MLEEDPEIISLMASYVEEHCPNAMPQSFNDAQIVNFQRASTMCEIILDCYPNVNETVQVAIRKHFPFMSIPIYFSSAPVALGRLYLYLLRAMRLHEPLNLRWVG
jgi:hypothetical protein